MKYLPFLCLTSIFLASCNNEATEKTLQRGELFREITERYLEKDLKALDSLHSVMVRDHISSEEYLLSKTMYDELKKEAPEQIATISKPDPRVTKSSQRSIQSSSTPSASSSSYVSESSVTKWMSGWDGSIYDFESQIKKRLHDADSYEHVETAASSDPETRTLIRTKFRAKNQFGAKVLHTAYGKLNVNDGTVSDIVIE